MKISKAFDGEIKVSKNGVKSQLVYNNSNAKVMHLTVEPGARLDTHTTPVDVFFYILEGEAWIEVGNERELAICDSIIESPKDIPHAVENYSKDKILRVLVTKLS